MAEYAALDLETTGLDPQRDRVIELGAVAFTSDAVLDTFEVLVDPGRSVPPPVLKLTGIQPQELRAAAAPQEGFSRLGDFIKHRQPVGHGATLDVDFLRAAGLWSDGLEILDTLQLARILLPQASSHSLPMLAAELGLSQPRPHRALDDADATRQLLLRLREEATRLEEGVKEAILALIAPYDWVVARFFAEALTLPVAVTTVVPAAEPPGPRARARPPDEVEELAALLGPDGPLATSLPGYEAREEQVEMLRAVAQTMRCGGTLLVEAGTGTGKSLAYLIPALARARADGERAVVSTHTHTLQEQLVDRDLPALAEWLPWDFKACLLKGRPNYVSLRRWHRYLAQVCANPDELTFKLKVLVWLHRTKTGDRSELRLQGQEEVLWARIASDPLDCVGIDCTAEDCFVHRARAEAEAADLVVVNHALLLADAQSGGAVLPPYDHLIVDEAHHLEDAGTQALRQEVEAAGLLALLDRLAGTEGAPGLLAVLEARPRLGLEEGVLREALAQVKAARGRAERFFAGATEWVRAQQDPARREESVRLPRDPGLALPQLAPDGAGTGIALSALASVLGRIAAAAREWSGGREPEPEVQELDLLRSRLGEAGVLLHEAFAAPDPNRVYWLFLMPRSGSVAFRSAPLLVGPLLAERVYAGRASVIFTSASLTVGDSFEYFRQRLGIGRDPGTLRLASPFNYLDQALVCLPSDLPPLDHPDYPRMLVDTVAEIGLRLGGRTLVLFTSHSSLHDTYYALKQRPDLDRLYILGQGIDGQRRHLLKAFAESERPLLLGTASFWEGIDLPGDQLACVIVVKLPFPAPTEPVFAARAEQYADAFRGFALPQAVLRLKQGFGRLIRTRADRGAVVILDQRMSTRQYGPAFLAALPRASVLEGRVEGVPDAVAAWVAGGRH